MSQPFNPNQTQVDEPPRRLFVDKDADQAELVKQLGWFGDLAAAQAREKDDPIRKGFESRNKRVGWAYLGFLGTIASAGFVGLALGITAIVLLSLGKLKLAGIGEAAPSGPFVEVFAGYALLLFSMNFISIDNLAIKIAMLGSMLVFVVVAFYWTRFRGVSLQSARDSFGTHMGRGLIIEMLCGIGGYLALLPVLVIGFFSLLFLRKLLGSDASHPIQEMLGGEARQVALALFLGVILAPITEELMFRGALFAHLRRHMPWGLAAVIVAIIFATIHPQGVAAIPLLACVAINLAIIRYWRGSSIANITAHALNNGTVMLFAIMIAQ